MPSEPLTMLTEPQRDTCEICGRQTELKSYAPCDEVCFACALEDKGNGHKQKEPGQFSVRFRGFEPS